MTLIVAACDKPETKPPTNIEKDEKADTDTDSGGESGGGNAGKMGEDSGSGSSGETNTDGGEPADGEEDKAGTDGEELADGDAGDTDRYTVTFHMNGHGIQVPQQRNIEHGSIPTPPTEPSSASHNFGGWYTDDTLATKFTFGTDSITKDTDLYAKWTKHVFAFDIEEHKVAFTSGGTYTKAVGETNKPAGDVRNIEYTSSENAIAIVDNTGQVTFVTQGTVTITATKALGAEYPEATARYTLYLTTKPTNKQALVDEITRAMNEHGNEVDLNYIDTSGITNMDNLFNASGLTGYNLGAFNGDISKWDVSKVTNMGSMFSGATSFNKDISAWDVSQVLIMQDMFWGATEFKQNLDAWEPRINNILKANGWDRAAEMFKDSGLADSLPSWCKTTACKNRQG